MAKRQQLGLEDRSLRPWTGKPELKKRGISVQLSWPNFVDELLDLRLMRDNVRRQKPLEANPDNSLLVDVGQECNYQLAGGSVSLLTQSKIYVYKKDRCAISDEHLYWQGWGHDTNVACLMDNVIGVKRDALQGAAVKKRRGRAPAYHTKLKIAAGNGLCLGDFCSLTIPLIYIMNAGFFKRDLRLEDFPDLGELCGPIGDHRLAHLILDANLSQKELRSIDRKATKQDDNGDSDEDQDLDDDLPDVSD